MKTKLFILQLFLSVSAFAQMDVFEQQRNFFNAVKAGDSKTANDLANVFENLSVDFLSKQLDSENKKKAFWINYYNIYIQYLLTSDPSLFDDRDAFFKEKRVVVAQHEVSFDLIEHGILRRSKSKYSLGYLGKIFVEDFEEWFRLEEVDYRIHFALNCGAKSCPPVAYYDYEDLDSQLDEVSKKYLQSTVKYDRKENEVHVPVLAFWFNADFGGKDGIRTMLNKYGFEQMTSKDPSIEYLDYDWTLETGNYIEL